MTNEVNHDICNSAESWTSYRSRNTNYIGGDAQVSSAIQIAGDYHGGLDLSGLPAAATVQGAAQPGDPEDAAGEAVRQ
ncbi:hypothetical protein ACWGJ2_19570 [Streptomyces sp. NPDC054796]